MSASLNLAHQNTEETSHVIIQCTKCRTRFAVESEELDALSDPRFHCSQCDHVFREGDKIESEEKKSAHDDAAEDFESMDDDAMNSALANAIDDGVVAVYRNSTKIASFFRSDRSIESAASEPLEDVKRSDGRYKNLHSIKEAQQLQIPKGWDESMRSGAPRESASARELLMEHEPDELEFANAHNDVKAQTMPSRIPTASRSEDTIDIENFGSVKNAPLSEGQFNRYKAESLMPLQTRTPRAIQKNKITRGAATQTASVWKYLGVPVGITLVALCAIALLLQTSNAMSSKFVRTLLPGALVPAPGDLFIKNTRFENITLDSGEVVHIVTGTVVNNSEDSFSNAELETVLFDKAGKPLGSVRTNLNSNLASAKIHALTPEMINDIQKNPGAKHLVLRPGEERDFAVALMGKEFDLGKDFATRVYSAKEL